MKLFVDRQDAGKRLADKLGHYARHENVIVLGLPRGGVPVAYEVAKALQVPLDVFIVRKLGVPWQEELALGALAMGGAKVFNKSIIEEFDVSQSEVDGIIARESLELNRRNQLYRQGRDMLEVKGKTIILIDDGIATGATVKAAIMALKSLGCGHLVLAIPVAPHTAYVELKKTVDEIVCLDTPEPFYAIGAFYQDFAQTSDSEVKDLLEQARK